MSESLSRFAVFAELLERAADGVRAPAPPDVLEGAVPEQHWRLFAMRIARRPHWAPRDDSGQRMWPEQLKKPITESQLASAVEGLPGLRVVSGAPTTPLPEDFGTPDEAVYVEVEVSSGEWVTFGTFHDTSLNVPFWPGIANRDDPVRRGLVSLARILGARLCDTDGLGYDRMLLL